MYKNITKDRFNITNFSNKENLLILLLELRCINTLQVQKYFNFSNRKSANVFLKRLENEGYLYSIPLSKKLSLGNAYFLTNKGIEYALFIKDVPVVELIDGKLEHNHYTQYENKLSENVIPHAYSVNELCLELFTICKDTEFIWYDERESIQYKKEDTILLRSDASFEIHGNKYLVEQDMGTQTKGALQTKFNRYAEYINTLNINNYPTVIYNIDLNNKFEPKQIDRQYPNAKNIRQKIKELKEKLRTLNQMNKAMALPKEINMDSIDKSIEEINKLIQSPFISKKEKENLTKKLDNFKLIKDDQGVNTDEEIEEIKDKINILEDKLENIKIEAKLNYLEGKYISRMKMIEGFLLSNTEDESIYSHLKQGLDFYVTRCEFTKELLQNYISKKEKGADLITKYLKKVHFEKFKMQYPDAIIKISTKKRLFENHKYFTIDKHISFVSEYASMEFFVYDTAYNNVGGKVRLNSLLNNGVKNENRHIICITDYFNNAQEYDEYNNDKFNLLFADSYSLTLDTPIYKVSGYDMTFI